MLRAPDKCDTESTSAVGVVGAWPDFSPSRVLQLSRAESRNHHSSDETGVRR